MYVHCGLSHHTWVAAALQMKLSTTAPAPAGAAMLRDIRAW
jgi:hypothetical protein